MPKVPQSPRDWIDGPRTQFGHGRTLNWKSSAAGDAANERDAATATAAEQQHWAASKIRRTVIQRGTTVEAVAEAAGVTVDTLRKALRGETWMPIHLLKAVANELGLDAVVRLVERRHAPPAREN